jgi:hypothetical protein
MTACLHNCRLSACLPALLLATLSLHTRLPKISSIYRTDTVPTYLFPLISLPVQFLREFLRTNEIITGFLHFQLILMVSGPFLDIFC